MGFIAGIVKIFTGDEYESSGIVNYRRFICSTCSYRKNGYCGSIPVIGEDVIYNGEKKRLCGCITDEKTLLKNQDCPLKKW